MSDVIPVRNPRTGKIDYEITALDADAVAATANQLRASQVDWLEGGLDKRISVLQAWKEQIAARAEDIIQALATDTGRYLISASEVRGTPASIDRWCAQAAELSKGSEGQSQTFPHIRWEQQLVPYSLVGVISPWNFPVVLSLIDALPALLAGSAILIKPSEVTPRFIRPLMETIAAVPELHKVLRLVEGGGSTGQALVDAADVVCFTGSVPTGRKVGEQAARNFIPSFLELGGKDPLVILESADMDMAVTAALRGSVVNAGQACQSIERIYVQRSIYEPFVEQLVTAAKAQEINYPDIHKGTIGPLIFDRQAEIIDRHLQDAVDKGAKILSGGPAEKYGGGTWCRPTVLIDVNHDMAIMSEETFGPVMPVMPFDTVDEAVALANDTDFGLSAGVMAGTVDEAMAVGRRLEAGGISINDASLTSIFREAEKNSFKLSGMGGSRMGPSGMTRFFRTKTFIINTGEPSPLSSVDEANIKA